MTWILTINRLWGMKRIGKFSRRHNDLKQKCSGGSEQDTFLLSEYTNLIVHVVFEKENCRKLKKKMVQGLKREMKESGLDLEEHGVLSEGYSQKMAKANHFFSVPQVFLSTRRGAWILNRVADYGFPVDVLLSSRFKHFLQKILGQSSANYFLERKMNQRFDHEMFGLKPKHRYVAWMGGGL